MPQNKLVGRELCFNYTVGPNITSALTIIQIDGLYYTYSSSLVIVHHKLWTHRSLETDDYTHNFIHQIHGK